MKRLAHNISDIMVKLPVQVDAKEDSIEQVASQYLQLRALAKAVSNSLKPLKKRLMEDIDEETVMHSHKFSVVERDLSKYKISELMETALDRGVSYKQLVKLMKASSSNVAASKFNKLLENEGLDPELFIDLKVRTLSSALTVIDKETV